MIMMLTATATGCRNRYFGKTSGPEFTAMNSIVKIPSNNPITSAPVSPMKVRAGLMLKCRKARRLPAVVMARTPR